MQQQQFSISAAETEQRMAEKVPSARPPCIKQIKSILDNRSQNKRVASPEFVAARKKLADLNAAFKEAVDRKKAHREGLELVKEKLQGTGSRSGLPEVSIKELDEQIQKLSYRQMHSTLPIDEEKRLIIQIKRLKRSRDSLLRHSSQAEQDQGTWAELIDLIRKVEQDLNNLKEEQHRQRQILVDLREKESPLPRDIPALIQERNEAYEAIKSLRDDIKQLKAEFVVKEEEYWRRKKRNGEHSKHWREDFGQKGRANWLEREKNRKQRESENFVEPYTDEIIICEQLLSYMLNNVPLDDIVTPEGFGIALIGKKNRNEDELGGWFAGSGGKKGKKSRDSSTSRSKLHEKISLSIDALSSFGKLKISPPVTYGDVAKSIEELKLKKDQYAEMQKADRELREKGGSAGSQALDGVDVEVHEPETKEPLFTGARAQIGGEKEFTNENLNVKKPVLQLVENGACLSEYDILKGLVKEPGVVPSICKQLHNTVGNTDNVTNGGSTRVLQVDQKIEDFHHIVEKTENGSNEGLSESLDTES
ncbi:hypothetical protein KP509_01G110400 [Ceratopteris richardii]|uniref:Uncharacterized protein n=1 Tax=Ceratopteris richardii TaxID=49495 RepID=A0A8T2VJV7_CERRI|nr:hypothetical protein KP509_01G110400 [Ceratopteris richardii]